MKMQQTWKYIDIKIQGLQLIVVIKTNCRSDSINSTTSKKSQEKPRKGRAKNKNKKREKQAAEFFLSLFNLKRRPICDVICISI
mgnify:CR=1 FL=1